MDRYMSLMAPASQHATEDNAAPADFSTDTDEDEPHDTTNGGPPYRKFMGDGSVAHGWPSRSEWLPFGDM
jgi:hypothetical protein